jgi:hypothetical protein
MNIMVRILVGSGLFVLGYYLGREVTRTRSIREEIKNRTKKWSETIDS